MRLQLRNWSKFVPTRYNCEEVPEGYSTETGGITCEYNQYHGAGWLVVLKTYTPGVSSHEAAFYRMAAHLTEELQYQEEWFFSEKEKAAAFIEKAMDNQGQDETLQVSCDETSGNFISDFSVLEGITKYKALKKEANEVLRELLSVARKGGAVNPEWVAANVQNTLFGDDR
jgi:hypothetical protein